MNLAGAEGFFSSKLPGRVVRSVLAASLSLLPWVHGAAAHGVQAVVYEDGRKYELSADALRSSGLLDACEAQVRGATSVLRLGVSSATIEAQRNAGLALEIAYPAPQHFVLAMGGRTIDVTRILIPLAGELSGSVSTIFFGTPGYESGPLRHSQGTAELVRLVRTVRPAQR